MKTKEFDLENFIASNLDKFDNEELPKNHKKRFIEKIGIEQESSLSKYRIYWALVPVACLAIFLLFKGSAEKEFEDIRVVEKAYKHQLQEYADNILKLSNIDPDSEQEYMLLCSTLDSIIEGDTELSEQITDVTDKREQYNIIKEYYSQKMAGLERIKYFYAENTIE